jgi:cytochrome bd-type quinol oxidase subunit 2
MHGLVVPFASFTALYFFLAIVVVMLLVRQMRQSPYMPPDASAIATHSLETAPRVPTERRKRFFRTAQILVILQVTFIIAGWGVRQYPYLIPPDITIHSAAAPHATLWALTAALAGGALILFPSFYYLFYVFKGSTLSSTRH